MKKTLSLFLALIMMLSVTAALAGCNANNTVTVELAENTAGLRNPLKGIRAGKDFDANTKFSQLCRWYTEWNRIETCAEDGVEVVVKYSEKQWGLAPDENVKIIPRVYLEWPNSGTYWPSDMQKYKYTGDAFEQRLEALIKKMGQAWDHDPRVAYIEMGIIGKWGEQHSPTPSRAVQELMGPLFKEYFQNKLVMVRYPQHLLFQDYEYGYYWDEWGSDAQWGKPLESGAVWEDHMDIVLEPEYADRWRTCVFGGENTNNGYGYFDGGRFVTYGFTEPFSPDEGFAKAWPQMVDYARLSHTNHMGTRYGDFNNPEVLKGMTEFQNALGYRFVIADATYRQKLKTGQSFDVSFHVTNTGSSPLYYDWPVQVALIDPYTREVVWRDIFDDVSASDWLPGDKWNVSGQAYDQPAEVYHISGKFTLPKAIEKGDYLLTLSILDPAGLTPSARFASGDYKTGGYTVLGMVGVGKKPDKTPQWEIEYDDPHYDLTPRYYANLALFKDCTSDAGDAANLTNGDSTNVFEAAGQGVAFTLDLGDPKTLKSAEILWKDTPADYTLEVSADGQDWQPAGRILFAKNNVTRQWIEAQDRVQYVRVTITADAAKPVQITQFCVYGE